MRRRLVVLVAVAAVATCAVSCSTAPGRARAGGPIRVVAAENIWGSVAADLGGEHVDVTSLIDSPNADPHDYEPTAADGRAVAMADYAIVNGLGYDTWASDLIEADGSSGQTVLDVGKLLGLRAGENPHRWYFPADVRRTVDRITADYERIDPANTAYYEARHQRLTTVGLQEYDELLATIHGSYAGTRIAATENIVAGLAAATGLEVVTPSGFLDAITDGRDPAPGDKITADRQIATHAVAVLVVNGQNETPDVRGLVDGARANGIPVVTVSETPEPAGAAFQDWQTDQLRRLAGALAEAAGR